VDLKASILVFLGGGVGAWLRVALGMHVDASSRWFPGVGVLLVNLIGCVFIGAASVAMEDGPWKLGVIGGLVGGLTTFSSFALLLDTTAREGRWLWVGTQAATHLLGGAVAVVAGMYVARYVLHLLNVGASP
jgi:fluoride exporter